MSKSTKTKTVTLPMKKFRISLEVELDEMQLWPDGDGPLVPEDQDVMYLIHETKNLLRDWNLLEDLTVTEVMETSPKKSKKKK